MHRAYKPLLFGLALLASAVTLAQDAAPTVGQPWTGMTGVKETVAQIMKRAAATPKRLEPYYKYKEKTGPDRTNLPQNPFSLPSSQYPLPDRMDTTPLSVDRGSRGPLFSLGTQFDGASFSEAQAWPPDTMGDIGPSQVLVCVNGRIKLFDKNGNLGALNADSDVFFQSVRRANTFTTDPRVRYDRLSGRWFVIMIDALGTSSDKNNRVLVAVSSGSTITSASSFTFFQFAQNAPTPAGDANAFFDYPTLGIDANALYIGGNNFAPSYSGTTAFVIRKSSILGAGPMVVTAFRNLVNATSGVGMFTPQGVDNDDPAATTGYLIGVDNATFGTLVMRKITNPGGTPSIGSDILIPVSSTQFPLDVRPLGSDRDLDALDDRLYVAKIRTNRLTGAKTLWTSHNIGVNSTGVASSVDRTGSRWYEIENLTATPTVRQSGTLFDSSTNKKAFWIPAMSMTGQGIALIGTSSGGAAQRTAVSVAQRLPNAALGTLEAPVNAILSTADYNDQSGLGTMRWGDYSHTTVDPNDDQTAWTFQMYAKTNTEWAVRVVKLVAPPPAAISSIADASAAAGSSTVVTINGTSSNGSGFFDPGTGFPNRLAVAVSGSGVSVSNVQFVNPTQVKFTATVAAGTAAGTRNITVTNPDGQSVTSTGSFTITGGSTPTLTNLFLSPGNLVGGFKSKVKVTLSSVAPAGGTAVSLSSTNSVYPVPSTLTVLAGQTVATVDITTVPVQTITKADVTATLGGDSVTKTATVKPPNVNSLEFDPTSIAGGSVFKVRGTVKLGGKAPAGGYVINLTSSDKTKLVVPSSVTVPAGQSQVGFNATHFRVASNTTFTVTAKRGTASVNADVTLTSSAVFSLTFSTSSVVGGNSVIGTVKLKSPAPAGGALVTLSASNGSASVPASVTVPAGQTKVTFTVNTSSVAANTFVTITATRNGAWPAQILVKP